MVGYVDGVLRAELDLEALHAKRLHLFGVSNKLRTPRAARRAGAGIPRRLAAAVRERRLRPLVDRVFDFEQLEEARARMEAGEHIGKIVLAGSRDD